MIRAAEILGEVRQPKWRGRPPRVFSTAQEESKKGIAAAVAKRKAAAAIKREAAKLEKPLWVGIGAALHAERTRRKEQRKVTAGRIDTTPTSLGDYESGERPFPVRCWPKVLEVYGIDIEARVAEWRAR